MQVEPVRLDGEAQEVALAETQAVLAMVHDDARRAQLAELIAQIAAGEVDTELVDALEEIVELALASGRIRALYGPGSETAMLAVYRKLPRGTELAAAAHEVSSALDALRGEPIQRLSLTTIGPAAYQLGIAAGETELTIRLDRQGPRISSVTV